MNVLPVGGRPAVAPSTVPSQTAVVRSAQSEEARESALEKAAESSKASVSSIRATPLSPEGVGEAVDTMA